jgi:small subunit ribosomal protein S20
MPNTKSAAKQARSSARKAARNRTVKSRLKSLEKKYLSLVKEGKVDDAKVTLRSVASAYDKAAKTGVIKKEKANRKRSRLQIALNAKGKAAVAPAPAKS